MKGWVSEQQFDEAPIYIYYRYRPVSFAHLVSFKGVTRLGSLSRSSTLGLLPISLLSIQWQLLCSSSLYCAGSCEEVKNVSVSILITWGSSVPQYSLPQ